MAPKCVLNGLQVFRTVLDLPAELAQRLRQAAHCCRTLHCQYRQHAKSRPPQKISVIDRFERLAKDEIRCRTLQKVVRHRDRSGFLRPVQQRLPGRIQNIQSF